MRYVIFSKLLGAYERDELPNSTSVMLNTFAYQPDNKRWLIAKSMGEKGKKPAKTWVTTYSNRLPNHVKIQAILLGIPLG